MGVEEKVMECLESSELWTEENLWKKVDVSE
jgi:hypothetical protein